MTIYKYKVLDSKENGHIVCAESYEVIDGFTIFYYGGGDVAHSFYKPIHVLLDGEQDAKTT